MVDYNKKYSYVSEDYQKKRPNYSMQQEVFNTENIFGDSYKSPPPSCTKLVSKREDNIVRFTTKNSFDFIGDQAINHKKHFQDIDHFKNTFVINKKVKDDNKHILMTKEDIILGKNVNSKNFAKCKVLTDIYYTNPFEKIEINSKKLRTSANSKEKVKSSKIVENNQPDFDYNNFLNDIQNNNEIIRDKNTAKYNNSIKRSESAKHIRGISIGFGCSTKHDANDSVSYLLKSQKSTPEIKTLINNRCSKTSNNSPRLTLNNKSRLISSLNKKENLKDMFKGESVKELLNDSTKGNANNRDSNSKLNPYSLVNINKIDYLNRKFSSANVKNLLTSCINIPTVSDKITLSNVPSKSFLINIKIFKNSINHSTKSLII